MVSYIKYGNEVYIFDDLFVLWPDFLAHITLTQSGNYSKHAIANSIRPVIGLVLNPVC